MARIFIGVKMSEKIESLAARWAADKPDWPVRWIKPRNLHLTLAPPFYEADLEKIMGKLAEVKPLKAPAALRFREISYGPAGNYRLIWATGEPAPELEKIKAEIEQVLNLKADRRNFLPHLTLARFKPEDYGKFKVKNLRERIDWSERAEFFTLFESSLTPAGAEYKILKNFLLWKK